MGASGTPQHIKLVCQRRPSCRRVCRQHVHRDCHAHYIAHHFKRASRSVYHIERASGSVSGYVIVRFIISKSCQTPFSAQHYQTAFGVEGAKFRAQSASFRGDDFGSDFDFCTNAELFQGADIRSTMQKKAKIERNQNRPLLPHMKSFLIIVENKKY